MKTQKILAASLILSIYACAHDRALNVEDTYRKTLRVSVDGQDAVGTFSAKKKSSYHMEIYVPQKPNLVKLTSCHQERIFIRPGKKIEFEYRPNPEIEAGELPCVVEISALEESGKNQWGMIDFQLPRENIPARVHCNGEVIASHGSFICQSRRGLVQEIEFDRVTTSYAPDGCNRIDPAQGSKFFFSITEGNCFYLFTDKEGNLYRLVTYGYNEVLLDD